MVNPKHAAEISAAILRTVRHPGVVMSKLKQYARQSFFNNVRRVLDELTGSPP